MRGIRATSIVALVSLTWTSVCLVGCSRVISVYGPNESITDVTLELESTIRDIKSMLLEKLNVPIGRQKLFLNGAEVEDGKTALECRLWRFPMLKLEVDNHGERTRLDVKCDGGRLGQVEVGTWDLVKKVKSIIFFTLGSYPERLKLGGPSSSSLADDSHLMDHMSAFNFNSTRSQALDVYCVSKEPNLLMMPVKCLDGQTYPIKVRAFDTIETIKLSIEFALGIPIEEQQLLIDGADEDIQLENDKSLAHYAIWNYSGLKLMKRPKVKLSVICKPGINIAINVEPDEPIESIRSILAKELGIPNENQGLTFCGKIMMDGTRLSDYHDAREIGLVSVKHATITVNIVNGDKKYTAHGESHLQIKRIKLWIENRHGIPASKQRLFLNDLELAPDKTFSDYKLYKHVLLKLIVTKDTTVKFRVKNLLGQDVSFDLPNEETIGNLKKLIEESALGIPISKQRLFFQGQELQDHNTLRQYDISNDSLVQLASYSSNNNR